MARLYSVDGAYTVEAEGERELALLDHGRRRGGEILLEGAAYPIWGADRLLLPAGTSYLATERLCRALERAARGHDEALERRAGFQLIRSAKTSGK